jgi:hypothetical protein
MNEKGLEHTSHAFKESGDHVNEGTLFSLALPEKESL